MASSKLRVLDESDKLFRIWVFFFSENAGFDCVRLIIQVRFPLELKLLAMPDDSGLVSSINTGFGHIRLFGFGFLHKYRFWPYQIIRVWFPPQIQVLSISDYSGLVSATNKGFGRIRLLGFGFLHKYMFWQSHIIQVCFFSAGFGLIFWFDTLIFSRYLTSQIFWLGFLIKKKVRGFDTS